MCPFFYYPGCLGHIKRPGFNFLVLASSLIKMKDIFKQISNDALNTLADAIEYSLMERENWVFKSQGEEMVEYIKKAYQENNKEK